MHGGEVYANKSPALSLNFREEKRTILLDNPRKLGSMWNEVAESGRLGRKVAGCRAK